jgi:glucosamine kinase
LTDLFAGVDGGATRATVLITDAQGNALARLQGGPGIVQPGSVAATGAALARLLRDAIGAAGGTPPVRAICCALAGAGREPERAALQGQLEGMQLAARVRVTTDAEAALYDAFADGPGLLLIAGTGSVGWGRAEDGRVQRVGGWGEFLGDEGSAYAIARHALRAVARAHDGRSPPTALTAALLAQLGFTAPDALIAWTASATKGAIAALAPAVLDCAATQDAAARAIRLRAVEHLAAHVTALHERLGPWQQPPLLAGAGALLEPAGPLRSSLLAFLQTAGPQITALERAVDAARGAAATARTH